MLLSLGLVTPGRPLPSKARPALIKKASNTPGKRGRGSGKAGDDVFKPDAEADVDDDHEEDDTPSKTRRTGKKSAPTTPVRPVGSPSADGSGLRRSARGSAKRNYTELKENDVTTAASPSRGGRGWMLVYDDDDDVGRNGLIKQRNNKRMGERTQDPYVAIQAFVT